MSEQRQGHGLFDFSQLRRKNDDYNTTSSKNSNGSQAIDFDLDSNEQIMKSFKDLRDKLKIANRQNQVLREEMSSMQVQVKQLHQSEKNLMTINHQLKDRNQQIQQSCDQLKKRIIHLKQQQSQFEILKGEQQFLKQNFLDLKAKKQILEQEKKKIVEFSIEDKINFQQKLDKLLLKKQNDDKYIAQVETDLCKAKQTILKLQNQIKKLQIKYDEEVFNKKWSKENFERQHYEKKNAELQTELSDLKSKHRKQKEKRADLERRLLELQQMTGFCNVKAEAYEGEVELMSKKVKKMERRISQAKQTVNKVTNQKVNYEQKFYKSAQICEELVNRVKRQLMGDVVQLAKTTQYKLNRLKDNKETDKSDLGKIVERLSNPHKKPKSDKKSRQSVQKQNQASLKPECSFKYIDSNSETGKILFESDSNRVKEDSIKTKIIDHLSNQQNPTNEQYDAEFNNIELKVRKQRQEMEKKLKQKMLYRRIQLSSSPKKAKLRQEYLKMIFEK